MDSSDLREELARVLAFSRRGVTANVNDNDRRQAAAVLDKFALVQLPSASLDDLGSPSWRVDGDRWMYTRLDERGRVASLGVRNPSSPEDALAHASALIAAARHAMQEAGSEA